MSAMHHFASREADSHLKLYESLIRHWNKTINIVSPTTIPDIWARHFADSLQLFDIINDGVASREAKETALIADLGSGGGFPGMVLAVAGLPNVHLIESDQRKCAFLREVSRAMADLDQNASREAFCRPTIHNQRIEAVSLQADIITARAFATVEKILSISEHLRHPDTLYILLKQLDIEEELTEATKSWYFNHDIIPSKTDARGCILILRDVKPR